MQKRIYYSQNFIKDKNLIEILIKKSSITKNDLVLDIGAGLGVITKELLNIGSRVIAIEIDDILYKKLKNRFVLEKDLDIINGDILKYSLPTKSYKVFSNIPFNITSSVIRKLTTSTNPPKDTYLIVQKETVKRYIGKPYDTNNSQISTLLKPWFKISVEYVFNRGDFNPIPNVDCFLMRIEKRATPLISDNDKELFYDLVTYTYNQRRPNITKGLGKLIGRNEIVKISRQFNFNPTCKPSELELRGWIRIFNYILNNSTESQKRIFRGTYKKLNKQQGKIHKISRTRLDNNWRSMR